MAVIVVKGERVCFDPFEGDVDKHFSRVGIDVINIICEKEYGMSYRKYLREANRTYDKEILRKRMGEMKKKLSSDINSQFSKRGVSTLKGFANKANKMDFVIGWNSIVDSIREEYDVPDKPTDEIKEIPEEPSPEDSEFDPEYGVLDYIIPSRRKKKKIKASEKYRKYHRRWKRDVERARKYNEKKIKKWKDKKEKYKNVKNGAIEKVRNKRSEYENGEGETVERVVAAKIKKTDYPSFTSFEEIKQLFDTKLESFYDEGKSTLILYYELPELGDIPTRKKINYIYDSNYYESVSIESQKLKDIYRGIPNNIALRIIKQVFEFDFSGGKVIDRIVFNGFTSRTDQETEVGEAICKISVECSRGEFREVDLSETDPQAAFEYLGGASASSMGDVSLVIPIIQSDVEDSELMAAGSESDNPEREGRLMEMDWEEFEYLIVELFEKEFTEEGGEVIVIQAGQEEGIDAIAHDADPLRGGKFVIQAKRATQTVGVSAVQELHETLKSEDADRGVLVTTSGFSPSAHGFAKDKLIQLLNGDDLLRLFDRHGYEAQIDLGQPGSEDE